MGDRVTGWCALKVRATGRYFDDLLLGSQIMVSHPARAWCPPTDVFECEEAFMIKVEISGLPHNERGDVIGTEILVDRGLIVIRGTREDECPHGRCSCFQMEIHYGPFECRVEIREPFDAERVTANYRDGFLVVMAPKGKPRDESSHRIVIGS